MTRRVLVFGYGNPSRNDDGLGPKFAKALGVRGIPGVDVETDFQLQIEGAALITDYDLVIFVDADASCSEPFVLREVEPQLGARFTTHSAAPEMLAGLAREHFGATAPVWVLGIRGYEFEGFGEHLSSRAARNMSAALEHLERELCADRPLLARESEFKGSLTHA